MTPLNVGFTMSNVLNVSYYTIRAPVLVSDETHCKVLKKDMYISKVLDIANNVESSITKRLISVDFPMKCPVIGVARGKNKILPILGAIRSGFIQGLVVNESVACEINKRL